MSYHKRQHNKPAAAAGNAPNDRPNVSLSHLCSEKAPCRPSLAGGGVSSVSLNTTRYQRREGVCTGVCTRRAFLASAAHVTHGAMPVSA